jgi:hypothetical protein
MSIHVAFNHQCKQCGAFYVPYDTDIPCPKCGIIEDERFDYIHRAAYSLRMNKMLSGAYTPGAWYVGSLGDHILHLLFPLFDAYEKEHDKPFNEFAAAWFSDNDWKDQQYLQGHIIGIAIRLHEELKNHLFF